MILNDSIILNGEKKGFLAVPLSNCNLIVNVLYTYRPPTRRGGGSEAPHGTDY